jgi:hypothetical protein
MSTVKALAGSVLELGPHPRSVNRDMKSCGDSTPLAQIGILTESCVLPQVFYGSRRLAGRGVGTTAA